MTARPSNLLPNSSEIPQLRAVSLTRPISPPTKRIRDDGDVADWHKTIGYKDYCLWVVRLNASVIGYDIPAVTALPRSEVSALCFSDVAHLMYTGSRQDRSSIR
jgi:hypothetical protein